MSYEEIRTINDLLRNNRIRRVVFRILREINPGEHKSGYSHSHEVEENECEMVRLLERLDLVTVDWEGLEKQAHRQKGNRLIEITYEDKKVIDLFNRVSGKESRISSEIIGKLSNHLAKIAPNYQWAEVFSRQGVPSEFLTDNYYDSETPLIRDILIYYSSSTNKDDSEKFYKILKSMFHPVLYDGDEAATTDAVRRFNDLLKYDGLEIKLTDDIKEPVVISEIDKVIDFGLPRFDRQKGDIQYNNKVVHIGYIGDYQHHICDMLFNSSNKPDYSIGDWITEQDLEDSYCLSGSELPMKNSKWLKDAVNKINPKFSSEFPGKKLIMRENSRVRIIKENFV